MENLKTYFKKALWLGVLLILTSCANDPYVSQWESSGRKAKGNNYFLEKPKFNDQTASYLSELISDTAHKMLQSTGMVRVSKRSDADVVYTAFFGVYPVQTITHTYSTPIYGWVGGGSADFTYFGSKGEIVTSSISQPQNFQQVGSSVDSYNESYQPLTLTFRADDDKGRWIYQMGSGYRNQRDNLQVAFSKMADTLYGQYQKAVKTSKAKAGKK